MNKTETNCSYSKKRRMEKIAPNKWMYQVNKAKNISIICNQSKSEAVINCTGILETSKNCQIITESQILTTVKIIVTNASQERQAQLHQAAGSITLHNNVIRDIETLTIHDAQLMMHHWHHYAVIYVIVVILAISSIYLYKEIVAPCPTWNQSNQHRRQNNIVCSIIVKFELDHL